MKTINNELIRSFNPCYDPSKQNIPENETLPVLEWVEKYRGVVPAKDIIWLLCHNEFLSDKELRLFAVWCARDALKIIENPDARSIEACNVAERFANGDATMEELDDARAAAMKVAIDVAFNAAWAAFNAASDAAWYSTSTAARAARSASAAARSAYAAAWDACYAWDARDASAAASAATEAQLNELLTYFK